MTMPLSTGGNEGEILDSSFSTSAVSNTGSGIVSGVSVVRKKTRKAIRPGIIENSSNNTGNTGLLRPSIITKTENFVVSDNNNLFKKSVSQLNTSSKKKLNNSIEPCLKSESQIRSNVIRKSFKEDYENNIIVNECYDERLNEGENKLEEVNNDDMNNIERDIKQESRHICPFLVGSGSEASYEKSSELNIMSVDHKYKNIDNCDINDDKCLLEMISEMGINDGEGSLKYGLSNDIDELSKYFMNVIMQLETFGLNIQSKLEKLENELEIDSNINNCAFENEIAGEENAFDDNNKYNDVRYKKYNYLLEVKNRLLKELSEVEKELVEEELRINKEESERLIRIELYKSKKKVYKDELSSLTVIICWIEDSLQNYIYPLQKKQNEYKQELNREKEVLSLIKEELSKIEKQEKIVFDKIREIQDSKRFIGEEKELLQEQIRISKNSKTEKIKNGNFKEASLITQTINILESEVSQIEDNYLNILNQEKEFIEKIDRIKRNYINEHKRMDECKRELILDRKLKRKELKERLHELINCEFTINSNSNSTNTESDDNNNDNYNSTNCTNSDIQNSSDNITKIFESLSIQFKSQTDSVLGYEIALLESQDNEDDNVLYLLDNDQSKTKGETNENETTGNYVNRKDNVGELTNNRSEVLLNDKNEGNLDLNLSNVNGNRINNDEQID
ncbi:hypothetical protein FG379_001530 [Cryptosporidium bovis]|uniref:uncharacterized protein n=1 Tax=Cryptosporidium bovis TaxID=310047 RepID=UPI00351A3A25|nr:hypothetical protein FG379_001530 [Cryptosporidium bovis]